MLGKKLDILALSLLAMLEVSFHYIYLADKTDTQEPEDKRLGPFYFLNPCVDKTHLNTRLLNPFTSDVKKKKFTINVYLFSISNINSTQICEFKHLNSVVEL